MWKKIGAASEKYESRTKTAPAWGAPRPPTRRKGGYVGGATKAPTGGVSVVNFEATRLLNLGLGEHKYVKGRKAPVMNAGALISLSI